MSDCATRERFEQFLAGKLQDADEQTLCSHVEGCASCQAMLNSLVEERPIPLAAGPEPTALADFLSRLKKAEPSTQTDLDAPAETPRDESLSFLRRRPAPDSSAGSGIMKCCR